MYGLRKKLNDLSEKVKLISAKRISNRFNGAKYIFLDELQNYLVFEPFCSYFTSKNAKKSS